MCPGDWAHPIITLTRPRLLRRSREQCSRAGDLTARESLQSFFSVAMRASENPSWMMTGRARSSTSEGKHALLLHDLLLPATSTRYTCNRQYLSSFVHCMRRACQVYRGTSTVASIRAIITTSMYDSKSLLFFKLSRLVKTWSKSVIDSRRPE